MKSPSADRGGIAPAQTSTAALCLQPAETHTASFVCFSPGPTRVDRARSKHMHMHTFSERLNAMMGRSLTFLHFKLNNQPLALKKKKKAYDEELQMDEEVARYV